MTHSLVDRKGNIITSRCGLVVKMPGSKLPPDFTAWASLVTCDDCKRKKT